MKQNWCSGLTDFQEGGCQYADDTILFSDCDDLYLRNLKSCLAWFEQLSGMRINFYKSEIIPINLDGEDVERIAYLILEKKMRCAHLTTKLQILPMCPQIKSLLPI